MPMVLRMKHVVKSADLGNPTIEQLYQMYRTSPVPILQKQAAEITIRLNANPDDPTNIMASAGIGETAVPMEESGPGPAKPPGRTASLLSRPPQKAQRDEQWTPSIERGVPISIQQASALRGRETQRAPLERQPSHPLPVVTPPRFQRAVRWVLPRLRHMCPSPGQIRRQTFPLTTIAVSDLPGEEKRKGKDARRRARASPIKAKEKGIRAIKDACRSALSPRKVRISAWPLRPR